MNKNQEQEYASLLLGALLHDIGKLCVRPEGNSKMHPVIGAAFIEPFHRDLERAGFDTRVIDAIIRHHHYKDYKTDEDITPRCKELISMCKSGDGAASGERNRDAPETKSDEAYRPLGSIFAYLGLDLDSRVGDNYQDRRKFFSHRQVPLDWQAIFPEEQKTDPSAVRPEQKAAVKENYLALQEKFRLDFQELLQSLAPAENGFPAPGVCRSALVGCYSLLYTCLWAIPDAVQPEQRDISLFDHSRIASAITACLYLYHRADDRHNRLETSEKLNEIWDKAGEQEKFLLIKGDLSGIQDYLYDIANVGVGGVAKRLRTRSFFLSMLVENMAQHLLQGLVPEAELPIFCKIMASGGNFVLLAPNISTVRENLGRLDREINQWLFDRFQGELSFSLAFLPLSALSLELKNSGGHQYYNPDHSSIVDRLNELNRELDQCKLRKISPLLTSDNPGATVWNEAAFVHRGGGDFSHGLCPSCKKQPAGAGADATADEQFCSRCRQDRLFSEQFVKNPRYLCFLNSPEHSREYGAYDFSFTPEAPRHVLLVDKASKIPADSFLVQCLDPKDMTPEKPVYFQPLANYVPRFRDENDLDTFCGAGRCTEGRRAQCDFYQCITGDGDGCPEGIRPKFPAVKPFECLAAGADGEPLLGILKADVDWLGLLFSHGMGEHASLSRIATLSRMLDLFFAGWLTHFLRENDEDIYTVYSGGDDLLLVSSWDRADGFAETLAEKFREYTAENPAVTLSAGLAITKPGFPIARASRLAGDFLAKAKEVPDRDGQPRQSDKNGYHLFGITCRWQENRELDVPVATMREWTEKFLQAMRADKNPLGTGVVHALLRYAEMGREWETAREKNEPCDIDRLRYMSLAAYTIGRNIMGHHPWLAESLKKILGNSKRKKIFVHLRLPLTRALLTMRKNR